MQDQVVRAPASAGDQGAAFRFVVGQAAAGAGGGEGLSGLPGVRSPGGDGGDPGKSLILSDDPGPAAGLDGGLVAEHEINPGGVGEKPFVDLQHHGVGREVAEVAGGLPGPAKGLHGLDQIGVDQTPPPGMDQQVAAPVGEGGEDRRQVGVARRVVADAFAGEAGLGMAVGQVVAGNFKEAVAAPGVVAGLALDGEQFVDVAVVDGQVVPDPPVAGQVHAEGVFADRRGDQQVPQGVALDGGHPWPGPVIGKRDLVGH